LDGEGCSHGNGNTAGHNAVGTEIAALDIGDVHGTATTTAIAFFLAEKLGEHQLRISPLANAVAVAAVGRGYVIGFAERHGGAHGTGFLADGEMHGAVNEL